MTVKGIGSPDTKLEAMKPVLLFGRLGAGGASGATGQNTPRVVKQRSGTFTLTLAQ